MRGWMALALWAGCGGEQGEPTDDDRIAAILELEGDASAGADVYAASCTSCHGVDGSATDGETALSGSDIRGLAPEVTVTTVVAPPSGMLTFATMPDQDIADVAAHVQGL